MQDKTTIVKILSQASKNIVFFLRREYFNIFYFLEQHTCVLHYLLYAKIS